MASLKVSSFLYCLKNTTSVSVQSTDLQIDNGTHPFLLNRWCLGRMTNIKRTDQIEKIRCALGRGVKLTGGCGNADGKWYILKFLNLQVFQFSWRTCPNRKCLYRVRYGMHQRIGIRRRFNQSYPAPDRKFSTKSDSAWNFKNGQTVMVGFSC